MFYHGAVIYPNRPACLPIREMVLQMNPVNAREFRGNGCQSGLEPSVMIPKRPSVFRLGRSFRNFPQPSLRGPYFLCHRWLRFPAYRGEPGYASAVHDIAVHDHDSGLQDFAELDEGSVGGGWVSRPVMTV